MSVPVLPESCSHVLTELESLDPLLSAIRLGSNRLKCTCVSMSRKWLALGSSAGGLHLIQKEGWKQRLMLTHKEGALALIAFCQHDEDYIAVATSQGHVIVWELHLERRGKPERVYVSSEHRGRQVTALRWDTAALRVFVGDSLGKVSGLKINSSKQGMAAAFVMFPVQTITTVDSRVVQLDYLEGKLIVSSLTRCYLCDTDREKFWKIGNKERDGEFGACFLPGLKGAGSSQSLIFCARPGSRLWEVSCEGEVLSTHQFKKLLATPPVPVITHRSEPHYEVTACCPQSVAFPRLLCLSEHYVLSWTNRAVYIFVPQSVQVLLWSALRDVRDIAIYRNELLCLHTDGRVTHLYLLSAERCVERLLRREMWVLAAHVCCLYQRSVTGSRARKVLPADRLEHLKLQLSGVLGHPLMSQLEEVLSKLEPPASACSSRRSSISSHESFNVLDSGIYRVISRRGSQSDEDSGSLHSHQSEEEPMREMTVQREEERTEQDTVSHSSLNTDSDRSESLIPFHLPLSFRSTSPRLSLQAVKESVSSFVRKTKETIGTLHASSELRFRGDVKDSDLLNDNITAVTTCSQDPEPEFIANSIAQEPDMLQELRLATGQAVAKLQDPLVLFETPHLKAALLAWLPHLERNFRINIQTHPENHTPQPEKRPVWGHQEEEGSDCGHQKEEGPVRGPREDEEGPDQNHHEEKGPVQGHGEEGLAQGHRMEEEELARGQLEEEPAQGHCEEEGPALGQKEECGLAQGHQKEEEESAQGHRKEEEPAQGHRKEEEPAQAQPEEEPAQGPCEEEGPARGHGEQEGPALGQQREELGPGRGSPGEGCVWGGAIPLQSEALLSVPFMLYPQSSVPADLFKELVELSTLCFELGVFDTGKEEPVSGPGRAFCACLFIRNYFFLLDLGRVKRYISTCYTHTPLVWHTFILALRELTQSDPITAALDTHDLHTFLKLLSGEQLLGSPFVLAHASRLYETFGEVGLRSLVQFYPSILPCDIMGLCWEVPAHFLGYLDSLVKSHPEEQRLSLLEEILQPQSLRVHWLQVAVSHDAPHTADIMDAAGNPRPHSHRFSWGFAQLIGHFIQLPADQDTKEKMADICKHSGFWPGFLALCAQLERRMEAFTTIVHLDDISLLDGENGLVPETVEEWRFVLGLAENQHKARQVPALHNGDVEPSGGLDPESVALLLAKTIGPKRALAVLQDSGLAGHLSHRFTTVCNILSIAEKRQRALIQSMLERCDRFLWSQQA